MIGDLRALCHSVVLSLSQVLLFATPWTAAWQASLSFIISQGLPKFMSVELVMPSNHLFLCRPLFLLPSIFHSIRVFSNELTVCIRWPKIEASASASVLPANIQGWFPLGVTSLILLPRDSQESSPAPQFKRINSSVLSLLTPMQIAALRLEDNSIALWGGVSVYLPFLEWKNNL